MGVSAEGVETARQLEELRRLECDAACGFLLSRPVGADEISRLLADGPASAIAGRARDVESVTLVRPSSVARQVGGRAPDTSLCEDGSTAPGDSSGHPSSSSRPGPSALIAIPWLQRAHLIATTPLWLLIALLVACSISNALVIAIEGRLSPTAGLQLRAAVAAISTAWVIYASGWGSLLVIAYAIAIADAMRVHGSRAWRPGLAWSVVAVFGGEVAVELGLAPSIMRPSTSHAVAGVDDVLPRADRPHARRVVEDRGGRGRAHRGGPLVLPRSRAARGRRDRARQRRPAHRVREPRHRVDGRVLAPRVHRAATSATCSAATRPPTSRGRTRRSRSPTTSAASGASPTSCAGSARSTRASRCATTSRSC